MTTHPHASGTQEQPQLKANAIGFVDALSIGLASTAPAYSLAAVIGSIVVLVGVQAPAALLASFIPMFLVAGAFYFMNRADPDAGTSFSWVTRALGPFPGWMTGWAICTTGILVIGSLADVGARYTYLLFGADGAAGSKAAVTILAVAIIVVMTVICVLGTELSARIQNLMTLGQVLALLIFAGASLAKVATGDGLEGSESVQASWFSPFSIDSGDALILALLTGVFIYWGWESSVNLAEETKDSNKTPGRAAIVSTVILLVTYLAVGAAVVSFAGTDLLAEFADDEGIFATLAAEAMGSPWDKIVVLAIVTSAIASTQTTIIPASRTSMSMARAGAMPAALARIHPRFQTPHISTIAVSALALLWYIPLNSLSENFLFDTLTALALMIAFYYGLSGFACAIFYRRELRHSPKNLLLMGIAPLVGGGMLAYLFVKAIIEYSKVEDSYSGTAIAGIGAPVAIGVGFLILGFVLMVVWRLLGNQRFFGRRAFEAVHPEVAAGRLRPDEVA